MKRADHYRRAIEPVMEAALDLDDLGTAYAAGKLLCLVGIDRETFGAFLAGLDLADRMNLRELADYADEIRQEWEGGAK